MDPFEFLSLVPLVATHTVTVAMGLGLAATCGLRAFMPLLAINLMAMTGYVELADSFAFMNHWSATLLFGSATVFEFAGDKIPAFDHLMDSMGVVIRPTAATIAGASMITFVDPLAGLALGLIVGGGSAGTITVVKGGVRALSTTFTAGFLNPFISTVEDGLALAAVILAILAPVLFVCLGVLFIGLGWATVGPRRQQAFEPAPAMAMA